MSLLDSSISFLVVRDVTGLWTCDTYVLGEPYYYRGGGSDSHESVTRTDIKQTFFDIEEDKAPGPDGYSSGFYKAAWSVIGEEIMVAVEEFFLHGRLLKQVNATLLAFIPKVKNPVTVADFRPISCYNVIYKAITKILVHRIRPFLSRLVSPTQNAFIPGRMINDNILLAQELFAGYKQQRTPRDVQ
ncbi:UNVERIFIED_CONTAM: hypothetical protein Sradi_6962600 [Sesamum radiatum]|uniref:Reverse transcriptase domain-containing protein n=1 Tax=Sesamum radiatum TaxID=300843 RepID=A0AAW2JGQ4_SESRA